MSNWIWISNLLPINLRGIRDEFKKKIAIDWRGINEYLTMRKWKSCRNRVVDEGITSI